MTRPRLQRWVLLAAAIASGATAAMLACGQPYGSAPTPSTDAGPSPEASAGDAVADAAPADPCEHVRLPTPPLLDDAPADELPPFYLAIRTTTLGNGSDKIVGYDLDGVCTCDTRPTTAHFGAPSCLGAKHGCDLDGGVDNAAAVLAGQLSPFFSLDKVPQRLIDTGHRTLLIEIGKYNGKANDKEIAFGVALSDGIYAQGCPTSVPRGAKGIWTPGWCGDDVWSFLPEAVLPSTNLPLVQGLGFVHDGVISLQLQGSLQLPFSDYAVLPLAGAVLTGTLTPLAENLMPRDPTRAPSEREKRLWSLDNAIVGGRIKSTDLLGAIGSVDTSTGDAGPSFICESASFALAKQSVCDAVDVASTPGLDFDPQAKCDSLSIAVGFVAFPALAGTVHPFAADPNPCLPGPDGEPVDSGASASGAAPYRCP